ncbi:MAG: chromosome segregation protein SMC [Nitriliruptoraceae bacterium]
MFLKMLSARGFKSFADRTVFDFEPGITVIVGPNGSGKSNIVDALAWVLGTQAAKKVRGRAMSDVIFAGSPKRNKAAQARVEIVIDNSDGQLATSGLGSAQSAGEFGQIRIARVIHRDGETAYEINGEEVRALDIQELLSDSGLGRELHTIVGQGQLDEILQAKPEERRRYIEEAAGILKHRQRRERALRKLAQVDEHIEKLLTVIRELRRQLRPLERQAEAADKHRQLQAKLRDVRIRRAAQRLAELQVEREQLLADASSVADEQQQLDATLETARQVVVTNEAALRQHEPVLEAASSHVFQLNTLRERLRGTAELIDARRRHLTEAAEQKQTGRPPEELRAMAEALELDATKKDAELLAARAVLDEASAKRRQVEEHKRAHEQAIAAQRAAAAERREQRARLISEQHAHTQGLANDERERAVQNDTLIGLQAEENNLASRIAELAQRAQALDDAEIALSAAVDDAEARVSTCETGLTAVSEELRHAQTAHANALARAEGLRLAATARDLGAVALREQSHAAFRGTVAEHIRITAGFERAVAAILGPLADAVVVANRDDAIAAITWLRDTDGGAAVILTADATQPANRAIDVADATPFASCLAATDSSPLAQGVVDTLTRIFANTFIVDNFSAAVTLHAKHPSAEFVTVAGDVATNRGYRAGGTLDNASVVAAAAADDATAQAERLDEQITALTVKRDLLTQEHAAAKAACDEAYATINASDANISAVAEQLAQLNARQQQLLTQRDLVLSRIQELDASHANHAQAFAAVTAALEADEEPQVEVLDDHVDRFTLALEQARDVEFNSRVAVERLTEQLRSVTERAELLRQEADEVAAALAQEQRRRELRRAGVATCQTLAVIAEAAQIACRDALERAERERVTAQQTLVACQAELALARTAVEDAEVARNTVRERRHEADLLRQDVERRIDYAQTQAKNDVGMDAAELAQDHPEALSYNRDTLSVAEDDLVRKVGLLGTVNPLALEEFSALEQRHTFLTAQLDDLRRSKRDLAEVVVAVDARICEVFEEAFNDVAKEFTETFSTVFPGGRGRLVLTDPSDMLATGVEIEARPAGKNVTRLSLLSGGERSLTVLAFVFAIFRARPSPFYVLDEVDAALDDVNLQRLLRVIRSFRGTAQVIMVTHQRRSMEIADLLYGITMGPDAVTRVVSERLEPMDVEA